MGYRETLLKVRRALEIPLSLTRERLETGAVFLPVGKRYLADPYARYRRLRERDPMHRSRLVEGWVATRYDDIVEILKDARLGSDDRKRSGWAKNQARLERAGVREPGFEQNPTMLRQDPPDHTRLRSLVSKAFTPRAIDKLRERVETIACELLDRAPRQGTFDLIDVLAYPLPVVLIAEMLGVPRVHQARFKHWSDEVVRGMGPATLEDLRSSRRAWTELRSYLEGVAEQRRREPGDDLMSALLTAEEEGDRLSTDEVFATCNLLLVAGNETTTNLIGNGTLALLRNPEQLERLRSDPSLLPNAIEELLRYDSPVQYTSRIAVEPVDVGGAHIERGQEIILVLGAANRDPAHFTEPDRLDLARDEERHLSFGHGVHFCLGAQLARLEGRTALAALLDRYPSLELSAEPLAYRRNPILRGLLALPVVAR
jgi:pimeloyl-[acyl-carrier protein] synthase